MLNYLDYLDRKASSYLMQSENKLIGYTLFLFAFTFNRARIIFPILLCGVIGYTSYNTMLTVNGYKPIEESR